jgi:hypothetical protein
MSIRFIATASVATTLLALAPGVLAQTAVGTKSTQDDHSESSAHLIARYTDFAGSPGNSTSLVQGLESGTRVTLLPVGIQPLGTGPVTFTPLVRLSHGEVNIALSLAKAELAQAGINNPTPAQLQAALNGGTFTRADGSVVIFHGVLAERQSGMGWGQIANAMGVKLGTLMRDPKTGHAEKNELHEAAVHANAKTSARESAETAHANRSSEVSHSSNGGGSSHGGGGGGGGKK